MYIAGKYQSSPIAYPDGSDVQISVDAYGNLKTTQSGAAPSGGGITWGDPVGVVMTGASKTFVPANANRKALIYWSPSGNNPASYSLGGGAVTLAGGIPLLAGASPSALDGAACPVGIVTAIGTNTEYLYYVEGT